jgi:hypothetical protein
MIEGLQQRRINISCERALFAAFSITITHFLFGFRMAVALFFQRSKTFVGRLLAGVFERRFE